MSHSYYINMTSVERTSILEEASVAGNVIADVLSTSEQRKKIKMNQIIELLNATNDINLQTKLFSVLSEYLMLNKGTDLGAIIKCSAIYDKIHNVLSSGFSRRVTDALTFLSALLYIDVEECTSQKKSLAIFAKNMTRTSGCLAVLMDMFTNCMIYHDTWKALCHCLAVVCSGCEINQSYCTHLVPICINKCDQTNIDMFLILQSLVANHTRNSNLFLETNGMTLFTRDLLHYDKCLHLLTTVAQFPNAIPLIHRDTALLSNLRHFVNSYGPESQIGQKAMIILKHVELRMRKADDNIASNITIAKEVNTRKKVNKNITKEIHTKRRECVISENISNEADDTKTLMQNVVKEIFEYNRHELGPTKKSVPKVRENTLTRQTSNRTLSGRAYMRFKNLLNTSNRIAEKIGKNRYQYHREDNKEELSFSFLKHPETIETGNIQHKNEPRMNNFNLDRTINLDSSNTMDNGTDISDIYGAVSEENLPPSDSQKFIPIFSSTPKQIKESSFESNFSKITKIKPFPNKLAEAQMKRRAAKVQKRKPNKIQQDKDTSMANKSLGSRFLSVINESCTTLVKSVANIFKKKEIYTIDDTTRTVSNTKGSPKDNSCSFSFLNYMHKRDAVLDAKLLKNKRKNYSEFSIEKSCETCDDTATLKQKLAKDERLRKTVKKLKLGINLYGCDFKKISRVMWPRESYMTPVVLYNLYRKLLLK